MSQATILVIDDSATIRRLVDRTLSIAGYRVVLSANAEDGVTQAGLQKPDMILLDHQLPGTTGLEVCQQLLDDAELKEIPVVVSSTLRKKAYAEYIDFSNVVDMLPKPYSEELLTTTVSNSLDTGALIVASQTQGSAVPEVIHQQEDSDLSGTFHHFSLREILDFVNNSKKTGALEVEAGHGRIWFYVDDGRLQAVLSTGIDSAEITRALPESLRDLAPVLNLTVSGRVGSEMDGLVELLDRKVLDQRLLRMLLRHQAAMLVRTCFTGTINNFRFEFRKVAPPLYRKLPLDISLAALLVEGALRCDADQLPADSRETVYVKRAIHGQNLDRAGLAPHHVKVLGSISDSASADELAVRLRMEPDEVRRVLHGLCLADLVEMLSRGQVCHLVAFETDPQASQTIRKVLANVDQRYTGKVVSDRLALQLILKRSCPDAIMLSLDSPKDLAFAGKLYQNFGSQHADVKWIFVLPEGRSEDVMPGLSANRGAVLYRPFDVEQLVSVLDSLVPKLQLGNE